MEEEYINVSKGNEQNATVYYGYNDALAVTLVKAIFCEECEYWDKDRRFMALCACKHWSVGGAIRYTNSLDYCSRAIRSAKDEMEEKR